MHRNEKIAAGAALVIIAAFAAIFAAGLEDTLGRLTWFSNGANVIQWISGPATLAAVGTVVYGYLVRRCAMPWCLRYGEHPVAGCLKKVCNHHHTEAAHRLVHNLHAAEHALLKRLGHGETITSKE